MGAVESTPPASAPSEGEAAVLELELLELEPPFNSVFRRFARGSSMMVVVLYYALELKNYR